MSPQLKAIPLTPDDILQELVLDSLPDMLGSPHEIIAPHLPFEGNHILALDPVWRPTVVSYHGCDGGRALLAGLGVLDALAHNRAILYRLYPKLFARHDGGGAILSLEDMRLIVLSPTPPPGRTFLERTLPAVSVYTFRTVEIDGEIGLLLDASPGPDAEDTGGVPPPRAPGTGFRTGGVSLSAEEERYFRQP